MGKYLNLSDKAAIGMSFMCALHCVATPLLLLALPSLLFLESEIIHLALLAAIIPISILAISAGYSKHQNRNIFFVAVLGIASLIFAVIFGHDLMNGYGEVVFTFVGSIVVISAHIMNYRARKSIPAVSI